MYAGVQEAYLLGETHSLWYTIIPCLMRTTVLVGGCHKSSKLLAGISSVWANTISKTLHLMHEQVKLIQVPYDVSHPEATVGRPIRLDYDQLAEDMM